MAYFGRCFFTDKLQVLRDTGYDCPGEDVAIMAYTRTVEDGSMWKYTAIVANHHIFFNNDKRIDHNMLPDLGFGMDYS
jgi:hypothetical protein